MFQLLDGLKHLGDLIGSSMNEATQPINNVFDTFGQVSDFIGDLVASVPPFVSNFAGAVLFLAGVGLIVKLIPFIG